MQDKSCIQNNIIAHVVIWALRPRTAKLALKIAAIINAAPQSIRPEGT
jgi:hypothetical protein